MLNGTGVGHCMTMIAMLPSIFSILRDKNHLFRQPFVASSRDYDLICLFCFAKILYMHTMAIYFKATKWVKPQGCLCAMCVIFMHFDCLGLGHSICLFLVLYKTLIYYTWYKCDKLRKVKLSYYNNYYGRGIQVFEWGYCTKINPKILLQPN